MKIQKTTIITTIPICMICLLSSIILEFKYKNHAHSAYFSNILLGIFASGLLIVVTAIIAYWGEKGRYYKSVFSAINDVIPEIEWIIIKLAEKDEKFRLSEVTPKIEAGMNHIKIEMWNFTHFCKRNRKDAVIDTVIVCIVRITDLLALLHEENDKRHSNVISEANYEAAYNTIVKELYEVSLHQLNWCKKEVTTIISSLGPNRTLESLLDKEKAN